MTGSVTTLVALSVVDILLLIAGLAVYLFIVGTQRNRIADNLEACSDIVGEIVHDADLIAPGVESINNTGAVVAGALPLLYGMAEAIVTGATYEPTAREPVPAKPAMGRRRSRLHDAVGYDPDRAPALSGEARPT
jgi:uncharacterized membrane protein